MDTDMGTYTGTVTITPMWTVSDMDTDIDMEADTRYYNFLNVCSVIAS
jgi:hypothetical protein